MLTNDSFSYDSPAAAGSRGAVVHGPGMMRSRSDGGGGGGGVRVGDIREYVRDRNNILLLISADLHCLF